MTPEKSSADKAKDANREAQRGLDRLAREVERQQQGKGKGK